MNTILNLYQKTKQNGSVLIAALMVANGLNFVYNAYLGRVLTVENFGLITFINTLWYLLSIIANAFGSTVTHYSGFLSSKFGQSAAFAFFKTTKRSVLTISLALTLLWLVSIPFLARFYNIGDITSLLLFTPVIVLALSYGINRGYLQGNIFFQSVATVIVLEALSKLIFAVWLEMFGLGHFVYLSIPLSVLTAVSITIWLTNRKNDNLIPSPTPSTQIFPRRFFVSALITGLATSGFLTIDMVLVKHYLLPSAAGEYALLSLSGKMIFFFGSLLNGLIFTFVSRDLGQNKNPNIGFYRLLKYSIILTIAAYLVFGLGGNLLMPLVFGEKSRLILPYLPLYGLAIAFFTLSNTFVIYHLARQHFTFSLLTVFSAVIMIAGIYLKHQNITQIVNVIFFVSLFNLLFVIGLHALKRHGQFILRNIIDLIDLFSPSDHDEETSPIKERILILNWRDTKHAFAGGAEVYIHELAKRWVLAGNQVTQFCGNSGQSRRNEVIDGVRIIRRGGFYTVYIWAFFYYLTRFRGKYDVIIDCQNGLPFFTPLYAKESVYCLLFHVHQEVFTRTLSKPLAAFARVLENRMMPWAYRDIKFITISPSTKAEMNALGLGKAGIEIVYPGIDIRTFIPAEKAKEPLIVYIGRLQFYKSVHVLIKATTQILAKMPNAKVIIAGDGEERLKLQSLVKQLNLQKHIQFLGRISEEEKIKLYQKAWVFVNPSLKEGWGITTIEANACGTPVVASDVPGLRDSVHNPYTGLLVKYGSAKLLAQNVLTLIENSRLRSQMAINSLKWAKQFDWQKSAEKGLRIIQ